MTTTILQGDCLSLLPTMDAASVHAIVTDPPYHLGFMGKAWDGGDIARRPELWTEVFRVMKPGAHLLAFGGSRTFHRMACAIEDAGFEIRDNLCWLYGSGFPKSLDVSKAIDKAAGAERAVMGTNPNDRARRDNGMAEFGLQGGVGSGQITAPATPEAAQWHGWGTALKPAYEPIIMARKPFPGTVAGNVLQHGTGALNLDACRVSTDDIRPVYEPTGRSGNIFGAGLEGSRRTGEMQTQGRHPANVMHDGSDEVEAAFAAFGERTSGSGNKNTGNRSNGLTIGNGLGAGNGHGTGGDSGTASRFFYSAKADKDDRASSKHPTVKPLALMRWLVRLATPPGGTVLDCFAGSGTTLEAARCEGFNAIGIEREAEYIADINRRLGRASGDDTPLFAHVV